MSERRIQLAFVPRLLRAPAAATYLGMSETRFRDHVRAGRISAAKVDGRNRMWDVNDLDSFADNLPRYGEPAENEWDGAAL